MHDLKANRACDPSHTSSAFCLLLVSLFRRVSGYAGLLRKMLRAVALLVFVSATCSSCAGQNYVCPEKPPSDAVKTVTLVLDPGCENNPSSCSYYLSMGPNPANTSYVDIHLEGNAEGWIAVGFSTDELMYEDDVLGCKYDPSSATVSVLDTWNPAPRHTSNAMDPNQDGICTYSTAYENGRILCNFSRYFDIVNPGFDWDLSQSYYLLLGESSQGGSNSTPFPKHVPNTPAISDNVENVYSLNNSNGTSGGNNSGMKLIQAHGCLMVLAFLLSMISAAFIAAWTKPLSPIGAWFKAHVILMVTTLFLGCVGLITVIVANKDNSPPGLINVNECATKTVHLVLGFLLMVLMAINPIIALFRCKPESPKRWIFFLIHSGVTGSLVQILALVNIGIGLFLFQSGCGISAATGRNSLLWVYLAWTIFFVTIELILFGIFSFKAFSASAEAQAGIAPTVVKYIFFRNTPTSSSEMEYIAMDQEPSTAFAKFKVSNISIRIIALSMFLGVTVLTVIALVVMMSVGVNYGDT